MQKTGSNRLIALLLGMVALAAAGLANADPPARVARLGYVDGPVSFSPAGEDDWVLASLNRPLVTGDRLWTDAGARAELQIGSAAIRLGATTSVSLLNLDDRVAQLQLAQGTLSVFVRRLHPDQVVEIDTPSLAYVIRRPGQYRISVDPNGEATQVVTRNGRAEVYGGGASYVVDAGNAYRFSGTGLTDYESLPVPGADEFDRWAQERDRSYDNSPSARYVSPDVIGYQDLDAHGTWQAVPEYGNVWRPTRVSADWAPYRDGHWAWVDPWGWTWVDDAPWGFAVSHYGRWANVGGGWGWIPGPVAARAVYAPALVVFIGGSNFQVAISSGNVGAVGWFPLGPRDVYRPAYPVSRTYFNNVNVSNTVINTTNITNVYNNPNATNVTYVNQRVQGAVVTVPTTAFVQSQPVARAALRVPQDAVARASVTPVAAVAPMPVSVRGAAAQGQKPPQQVLQRPVVAKSTPPPAPVAFAAQERALAANPGKPIDPAALAKLRPTTTPAPAPKVEVVAPTRTTGPVAAPPPQTAKADPRGKGEQRGQPVTATPPVQAQPTPQTSTPAPPTQRDTTAKPTVPGAAPPLTPDGKPEQRNPPVSPPVPTRPPQVTAPPPTPTPPEQRNKPETRPQPPAPVAAPPGAMPPGAMPPVVAKPPQTSAPAPVQTPPEQRGKAEGRSQPPAPVATPPAVVRPPQPVAPAPVQAPPEQRSKPEARVAPPAPVAAPPVATPPVAPPPVQRAPPEPQRARPPEPPAAAKPMPSAPAPPTQVQPAPVARPPGQAAVPPPSGPPPKGEQRGKDKKADEPGKGDDEPKRK